MTHKHEIIPIFAKNLGLSQSLTVLDAEVEYDTSAFGVISNTKISDLREHGCELCLLPLIEASGLTERLYDEAEQTIRDIN